MEFITKASIVERIKPESEEAAKLNFKDPEFMKMLKENIEHQLRVTYSDLADRDIDIQFELKEKSQ